MTLRFPVEMARIALTFDDDPKVITSTDGIELGTRVLLRVLEELNQTATPPIRVTFFAVGINIKKALNHYPDVIEQIKAGGHEVQNHSYSHPANFHQLSPTQAVDEVRRNHDLIATTFGEAPRFFRPPNGFINEANQRAILAAMPGYQMCGWDRHEEKSVEQPTRLRHRVVSQAKDQQIVLLHVWRKTTLWSIRAICQNLQARQYQMVTVGNLERDPIFYGLKNPDLLAVA
ncbi:MAG: polysaccharide deacetylase family protein [Cyanobacteria bacterium P01_D01_bin.44]